MEAYYHGYFDPLAKALGPLFGKRLRYVMMDSWEAGTKNWTDEMIERVHASAAATIRRPTCPRSPAASWTAPT